MHFVRVVIVTEAGRVCASPRSAAAGLVNQPPCAGDARASARVLSRERASFCISFAPAGLLSCVISTASTPRSEVLIMLHRLAALAAIAALTAGMAYAVHQWLATALELSFGGAR